MPLTTKHEFLVRLDETIRWCVPRIDARHPKFCLRSEILRRVVVQHDADTAAMRVTPAMVEDVLTTRRQALDLQQPMRRRLFGDLLVCITEETNHNGLAEDCSNGYLDFMDLPPWDTWICAIKGEAENVVPGRDDGRVVFGAQPTSIESEPIVLVSWVPPEFTDHVYAAIDVECMGMLFWATSECCKGHGPRRHEPVLPPWFFEVICELEA